MAGSGYTFVEAINEVVEVIGEFPMTGNTKPSAQSDTTSNYRRAEDFIDRFNKRIQSQGWPENTTVAKKFTTASNGGNFQIDLTSAGTVLRVKSAGSSAHRDLVLRVDTGDSNKLKVFDANRDSFTFSTAAAEDIFLDVVTELAFENLTPHLQDVIISQAKIAFQRRLQGNMNMDGALNSEYVQAEAQAPRNAPDIEQPFNTRPMIPGMGGKKED
tara:strand:+ start:860 stop:1504 length:645 start_codon:yes stop_codon:yes gene_type:complete